MTYSKEEAEQAAQELVNLSIEAKELNEKIKDIKAQLKEYTDVEDLPNTSWGCDNGYVEVKTTIKYKLTDIPSKVNIDGMTLVPGLAEKAFDSKIVLSKEGKRMVREEDSSIMSLMDPIEKKTIQAIIE